jgi:hypothetical protein
MSKPAKPPDAAKLAVSSVVFCFQDLMWSLSKMPMLSFLAAKASEPPDADKPRGRTDPAVYVFWAGVVRLLAWLSLVITAAAILVGAGFLTLVSSLSRSQLPPGIAHWRIVDALADWLHTMPYHAAPFVSTSAILLVVVLCLLALSRRAALRSKDEDHRKNGIPALYSFPLCCFTSRCCIC